MVLLVVDAQELITTDKLYMADRFIANVKQLIGEARANGVEVIYVRHDDGVQSRGQGDRIQPLL